MMVMADAGFVFLAMPKAGSTALERHFSKHAQILFRRPPGMKHVSAATFESVMAPWLERFGQARSSYETLCLARHPVDRAVSWWRYRSRPGASAEKSTVDVPFPVFAERLVSGDVPLGTAWNFVTSVDGSTVIVDRIYRYEHLADAADWMAERLGVSAPELGRANVSPARDVDIDPGVRAMLESHYADDVRLYESAR